jgi:preprotein translocase subunit YajC
MNGSGSQLYSFVSMMAVMFAIVYFLIIRPQQKQKQDRERMLTALKRGDRVVTTSGIHGTVTQMSDHTVTLRVADQVKLEFDRAAVARVVEAQGDKDA